DVVLELYVDDLDVARLEPVLRQYHALEDVVGARSHLRGDLTARQVSDGLDAPFLPAYYHDDLARVGGHGYTRQLALRHTHHERRGVHDPDLNPSGDQRVAHRHAGVELLESHARTDLFEHLLFLG